MADTVNLVLYPQVKDGEDIAEVKARLMKTLSVDQPTVDSWYATENPTAILKEVDAQTAEKYADAIAKCGAECNLQDSGSSKSDWSLEQMTKGQVLFICPSCEHEEVHEHDVKIEECPSCGLIMAKWEEKMREEAEKEKIRRRLLRDQRLKGDQNADLDAKKAELERLRALELEIMKELGIKPPGVLWRLFEQHTFAMSMAAIVIIVGATAIGFQYADGYLDAAAYDEKVAEAPTEEMQGIAPVVAAAVALQQTGNQQVVTEIADASQIIQGANPQARQEIAAAAMQMMKGVEPEQFMAVAAGSLSIPPTTMISDAEPAPMPINIDTVGGITGLQGVAEFSLPELESMSPPLLEHGHESILTVLSEKKAIVDTLNPENDIVIDAIDDMDGSAIVNLMSSIDKDQEWDQFLLYHVEQYVLNGDLEAAERLAERIRNVIVRIEGYGLLMEEYVINEDPGSLRALSSRVRLDLDKIEVPDNKARAVLELGHRLNEAGSDSEPQESLDIINSMIIDTKDAFEEASLTARLAQAYMMSGDQVQAKQILQRAMQIAGRIPEVRYRMSAFTKIAQRYYDIRNTTLANEILSETAILAATKLPQQERSVAFGELAISQAYIGDFAGARQSIDNAAEGNAKQQLTAKVAEMLIGEDRYYEALSWMETLTNETQYSRLELRLSSALFYAGKTREAINRIEQSAPRMRRIYELTERGLLMSQYARFFSRFGREEEAERLFTDAEQISEQLKGRKAEVTLAMVALDRARVFNFARAKSLIIDELKDNVVKDPVDAEVLATELIAKNLLPASLFETE